MLFTVKIQNLVTNGNFSNGINGWSLHTYVHIGDNIFSSPGALSYVYQNVTNIQNNKLYLFYKYEPLTVGTFTIRLASSVQTVDWFSSQNLASHNETTIKEGSNLFTSNISNGILGFSTYADPTVTRTFKAYYMGLINVTTLINKKQSAPMFNTTFDLMTDEQRKLQLDDWVQNGKLIDGYLYYPTQIKYELGRLYDTKAALKTAINSKGGTITDESIHDFPAFVDDISVLDTSDATAVAGDILLNKTAYANGVKITGTIQSLNANTFTPLLYDQTIDAGKYLAGVQTIKGDANLLAENIKSGVEMFGKTGTYSNESVNPITADFVLAGKIGFVNGTKITGSMTNRGAVSTDITTKSQVVTILQGYHNGSGSVQISSAEQAKIIPENIKEGVTLLGELGTATSTPFEAGYIYFYGFNEAGEYVPYLKINGTTRVSDATAEWLKVKIDESWAGSNLTIAVGCGADDETLVETTASLSFITFGDSVYHGSAYLGQANTSTVVSELVEASLASKTIVANQAIIIAFVFITY